MQIWHWLRHRVRTADGTEVTEDLVRSILAEVAETLSAGADEPARERLAAARQVFEATCLVADWPQFFTGYAYAQFLTQGLTQGLTPGLQQGSAQSAAGTA